MKLFFGFRVSRTQSGFTLLEVLVAVALVVVVSTLAFAGLNALVQARAQTDAFAWRWQQGLRAWQLMRQDVSYAIPRPSRNTQGHRQAPLTGRANGFELLRYASRTWPPDASSPVQKVRWRVHNHLLTRSVTVPPESRQEVKPQPVLSFDEGGAFFEYQDMAGRWHHQWPPVAASGAVAGGSNRLPRAIRWHIGRQNQHVDLFPLAAMPTGAR